MPLPYYVNFVIIFRNYGFLTEHGGRELDTRTARGA